VSDGDTAHPEKKGTALPHRIFGPRLMWPNGWAWIKMPLGTEVNLGRGDVVLDGVAASH